MTRSLKIFQDESRFPLDDIRVASPCPAEWGDMVGSDTVRFCASCQKNVYNLSGMKRDDAVELLRATEGRMCVRFFRRPDGTVLTEDCPVGVAAVLRRAKRATYAAAAISIGAVAALLAVLGGTMTRRTCERLDGVKNSIVNTIQDPPLMGAPAPMQPMQPMQGDVGVPEVQSVPTMGEPTIREVKGDVVRPVPVMGKIAMPAHKNKN